MNNFVLLMFLFRTCLAHALASFVSCVCVIRFLFPPFATGKHFYSLCMHICAAEANRKKVRMKNSCTEEYFVYMPSCEIQTR